MKKKRKTRRTSQAEIDMKKNVSALAPRCLPRSGGGVHGVSGYDRKRFRKETRRELADA